MLTPVIAIYIRFNTLYYFAMQTYPHEFSKFSGKKMRINEKEIEEQGLIFCLIFLIPHRKSRLIRILQ